MSEVRPSKAENSEAAKRHQVSLLVNLNRQISEMIDVAWKEHAMVSDVALDVLREYCASVAHNDPEVGYMMVEALESADGAGGPADLELSDYVRKQLGMPGIEWPTDTTLLPPPPQE